MHFIGIDLAWTYRNESGVCIIDKSGNIVHLSSDVYSDEQLVSIIEQHAGNGAVIAVDAPLIVNNETGSRSCERLLNSDRIHGKRLSCFHSNRSFMEGHYGCVRGEKLVSAIKNVNPGFKVSPNLWDNDCCVIETFPTGIFLGLFPEHYPIKYKVKNGVPINSIRLEMTRMLELLNKLNIIEKHELRINNISEYFNKLSDVMFLSRIQLKHLEEKVDAFLCAYGAYWCHANRGSEVVYGDTREGFIFLPVAGEDITVEKFPLSYKSIAAESQLKKSKAKYKEFFNAVDRYYGQIDWEPDIKKEWIEEYLKTLIEQGAAEGKMEEIWDDIYAFSQYMDRTEYRELSKLPYWEYSVGLEWISSHIFHGSKFEITLKNAKRLLNNLRDFYKFLISKRIINDNSELEMAYKYMCSGRKLKLVKRIPYTGKELWSSIGKPGFNVLVNFYMVDYWLMVLFFYCEESWEKLLEEAEKVPNSVEKIVLIKNFKNKLALIDYDHPKKLMRCDVTYDELDDAKKWFYGK